jgi:hypothetical protein
MEFDSFHCDESCKADHYEPNDHKYSSVSTNKSCDTASQSMNVNRSICCFLRLGKLSPTAQIMLVLRVALPHERFSGVILNLWSY